MKFEPEFVNIIFENMSFLNFSSLWLMYTSVRNPDIIFKEIVLLSAIILSNEKRSLFDQELSYKTFKVLSF